jgi:hypothetical protein
MCVDSAWPAVSCVALVLCVSVHISHVMLGLSRIDRRHQGVLVDGVA